MSLPIAFVRTKHVYASYFDFWRLVELAGFPTISLEEFQVDDKGIYILSPYNDELRPHIDVQRDKERRAHLVLWDLERPEGRGGCPKDAELLNSLTAEKYVNEVWSSDRWLSSQLETRFIVLGSDSHLGEPGKRKEYDFCHMSYVNARRNEILSKTDAKIGPNCWEPERQSVLEASKFGLMIHQDVDLVQEPLRLALFAAYGLPVVSELCEDAYPWSEFAVFSDRARIMNVLAELLAEPYEEHRLRGLELRRLMTEDFSFRKSIEKALRHG